MSENQADEQRLTDVMEFRQYYQNYIRQNLDETFVIEHTGRTYYNSYPMDYESLFEDEVFKSKLNWRVFRLILNADRLGLRIERMKALKNSITEELQKL